jgi:beta-galactosidase
LRWNEVVYEPGELTAVTYNDGDRIGSATVRTTGPAAAIRLSPDRTQLVASGDDLCYVLVEAVDEAGSVCPLANNRVHFTVSGPAEIAGVGNGDPLSIEPFQADDCKLFFGKAMLIVRTLEGQDGEMQITAAADGLKGARATVHAQAPPAN